jgi:phosphatidylinositol-3-phosphatase
VKQLTTFGRFWYDFIIGDDWRLALGVLVAIAAVGVAARHGSNLWWFLPAAVVLLLTVSVSTAATQRWRPSRRLLVGAIAITVVAVAVGATVYAGAHRHPATPALNSRLPIDHDPGSVMRPNGHLVVVIEENRSVEDIIGSPDAPRLNALARRGVQLTNYFAVTHPSQPNYIAMTSGGTQGIRDNCGSCVVDVPNLVDQLEQAKISWHLYAGGYPGGCSRTPRAGSYAIKHIPLLHYKSVVDDPAACAKVLNLDQLASDAQAGALPTVSLVVPDLDHDMHGTGQNTPQRDLVRAGDETVGHLADVLQGSPAWTTGSRLIVTWDEGRAGHGRGSRCCDDLASGGHIPTLVVGPDLSPGTDATYYDHYSLLASIEERYGLDRLGYAADITSHVIPATAAR